MLYKVKESFLCSVKKRYEMSRYKMKRTIQWVMVILVITFLSVSVYFNVILRDSLEEHLNNELAAETQSIAKEIDAFLGKYHTVAKIMGNNHLIVEYVQTIKPEQKGTNHPLYEEVLQTLKDMSRGLENAHFTWITTNVNNDYITEHDNDTNNTSYIYSEREWYKKMLEYEEWISVSPVYRDFHTKEMVVSIFSVIPSMGEGAHDIKKNIGQVGVDITVASLIEFVESYHLGDNGYVVLLDQEGNYVVPRPDSDVKNIREEETKLVNISDEILQGKTEIQLIDMEDSTYYVSYTPIQHTSWYVVGFLPAKEHSQNIARLNGISGGVGTLAILIVLLFLYILKISGRNDELVSVNQQLEEQERKIKKLASTDPLTGLPNRRSFMKKLNYSLTTDKTGGVILLDLDNFKAINDTLGHVFGDKVLQTVGSRLQELSNPNIFVSRFGGDEFLILINQEKSHEVFLQTIHQLESAFAKPIKIETDTINIKTSMGIAKFPEDSNKADELIMFTDTAMYVAKKEETVSYVFFNNQMATSIAHKLEVENKLRNAIENNGFYLVYQPQINVSNGEIVGAEALLRMRDEQLSPGVFIPVAEDIGCIVAIGRIVTKLAVEQVSKWKKQGKKIVPIAINFSAKQANEERYYDFLTELLEEYEVEAKWIQLELTESIFIDNKQEALQLIYRLHKLGIKISLDDFGTGYSSINYLSYLPIDKLKLDKSLSDQYQNEKDKAIIKNSIELAHDLNMEVVAEGVEEKNQVEVLREYGCDTIQGYYYSKPLTNQVFESKYL